MLKPEEIEELKNYFVPNMEYGNALPNPKDVPSYTIFYLKTGLVYIEHIMFNNAWHKKVVDSSSQVILEKV